MSYQINEVFYTLQGEGFWTGRPAVFVRFSRCNLWTGREEDRHRAVCKFCDTDFVHADKYSLGELIDTVADTWGPWAAPQRAYQIRPMVVLTGGEPALQVDQPLIDALHDELGCYIAIETNGTQPLPDGIDWICVSPKAGTTLLQRRGDELKVVWPQDFSLKSLYHQTNFTHYWLSPMDGPDLTANTAAAVECVLADPRWRVNVQTHKLIGVR